MLSRTVARLVGPLGLLALLALVSCAEGASPGVAAATQSPQSMSDDDRALYALGVQLAVGLRGYDLSDQELELVLRGLREMRQGEAKMGIRAEIPNLQRLQKERQQRVVEKEKAASTQFVEQAAAESGAERTESGLVFKTLQEGSGSTPTAESQVKVHYHGTLRDGTVFDSSVERGEPATFALNGVIPCWTEGVQKMKVGGKAKLVCPSSIAYGDRGAPPSIMPGAALSFEVELLEVVN
jgi:FKBP-type peptidyl-prolyl cis-trans isomerase